MSTSSEFPKAVRPDLVGEYPALSKSGGGYFYDEVLEYRVWCRPWLGAPDKFDGEIYFQAFSSFEEALNFSESVPGTEVPLVLVRQLEWVNEPEPNKFIHEKGERITEWRVEWLSDGNRQENSITDLLATKIV